MYEPEDIKTFKNPHHREPRITHKTFCSLFDDHSKYENFIIVDCRSAREYEGGHIKGSIRWHPNEKAYPVEDFFKNVWKPNTLYIFHCEYSEYRCVVAWEKFTNTHIFSNCRSEPLHALVLDGGYKQFYQLHPEYCEGEYIPEKIAVQK